MPLTQVLARAWSHLKVESGRASQASVTGHMGLSTGQPQDTGAGFIRMSDSR